MMSQNLSYRSSRRHPSDLWSKIVSTTLIKCLEPAISTASIKTLVKNGVAGVDPNSADIELKQLKDFYIGLFGH